MHITAEGPPWPILCWVGRHPTISYHTLYCSLVEILYSNHADAVPMSVAQCTTSSLATQALETRFCLLRICGWLDWQWSIGWWTYRTMQCASKPNIYLVILSVFFTWTWLLVTIWGRRFTALVLRPQVGPMLNPSWHRQEQLQGLVWTKRCTRCVCVCLHLIDYRLSRRVVYVRVYSHQCALLVVASSGSSWLRCVYRMCL